MIVIVKIIFHLFISFIVVSFPSVSSSSRNKIPRLFSSDKTDSPESKVRSSYKTSICWQVSLTTRDILFRYRSFLHNQEDAGFIHFCHLIPISRSPANHVHVLQRVGSCPKSVFADDHAVFGFVHIDFSQQPLFPPAPETKQPAVPRS